MPRSMISLPECEQTLLQAVILAGGKGTRLQERLNGLPKPLVDVNGSPLLKRQLDSLQENKCEEVLVLVSHGADEIRRFCTKLTFGGMKVRVLDEGEPLGTAGALLSAYDLLDEEFLVIYGDTLFDVDLQRIVCAHREFKADATLFVHPNDHPFDSDIVEIDDQGKIIGFHRPPHEENVWLPNLVNAAMYVINRQSIEFWRHIKNQSDIAQQLFPAMLVRGANLRAYISSEYIKDIGTPKRLDKGVADLRSGKISRARIGVLQKAVFLDRDGTLNELKGHISRAEDIVLIDGSAEAIKRLNEAEFRSIVITNQPVIARGECSPAEVLRMHSKIQTMLGEKGAFLDRVYYCPHHPDAGFIGEVPALKIPCDCRKPSVGMIQKACAELNIESSMSWLIGDTTSDLLAARRAGLKSILVETGEGGRDGKYKIDADFRARDLSDAVSIILDVYPRLSKTTSTLVESVLPGSVILIGGLARLGKSTLAGVLKSDLLARGLHVEVLRADGFIRDHDQRQAGVLGRFDLYQLQEVIAPWLGVRKAENIRIPVYDRILRRRSVESYDIELRSDTVLIIEGVPVLNLDLRTDRAVHRLYVDGVEEIRKARVVDDMVARGLSATEALAAYEARVVDENPIVKESIAKADVVVSMDSANG